MFTCLRAKHTFKCQIKRRGRDLQQVLQKRIKMAFTFSVPNFRYQFEREAKVYLIGWIIHSQTHNVMIYLVKAAYNDLALI